LWISSAHGDDSLTSLAMNMSLTKTLSIVGTIGVGAVLVLGGSANAAELTVTDAAHDTARAGLDIVGASLDNDDYALSASVNFRKNRSGTVVIGVRARNRGFIRIVSKHHADGGGRSFLVNANGRLRCSDLTVSWHPARTSVSFAVPSTCLWGGNYGAVRAWILSEDLTSGTDVDYAPEHNGSSALTAWLPRG
jgi:hypothetical protein